MIPPGIDSTEGQSGVAGTEPQMPQVALGMVSPSSPSHPFVGADFSSLRCPLCPYSSRFSSQKTTFLFLGNNLIS